MTTKSWNVPIVKLNKKEVVVDLGGGHLVNLVDLVNEIKIKKKVILDLIKVLLKLYHGWMNTKWQRTLLPLRLRITIWNALSHL